MEDHTSPSAGFSGVPGSPRLPSTARTVGDDWGRRLPMTMTVGVP